MISENTLEDTVKKIQEIPPEKRRIILYTGVHPNEGTTQIASQNEHQWEQYGVLVVAHPSDSTPHAIWQRQKELCSDGVFRPLDHSIKLIETEYEDAFNVDGSTEFFIRFHGADLTPGKYSERGTLEIYIPGDGRKSKFFELHFALREFQNVKISKFGSNTYSQPNNRLVVEYGYFGDEVVIDDPFLRLAIEKEKTPAQGSKLGQRLYLTQAFDPDDPDWDKKHNIAPKYLEQRKLNEKDIEVFSTSHLPFFNYVLECVSKKINSKIN